MTTDDDDPRKRNEEYSEIWETFQLEDAPDSPSGFAETRTMKPSDQTRVNPDGGEPFAKKLPKISGEHSRQTMPEVQFGRKLGQGGSAEVVAAKQVPLDREVAVKRHRRDRKETKSVLLQEAWITGRLEHPNIVPVYRLGRDSDAAPVMVMKRIGGVSWKELLDDPDNAPREFDSDDPLDWHLEILTDVCDAIRYAHNRSVIHRDLKPENVMVGAFGEIYVLDWGLAVSVGAAEGRIPKASEIDEPAGTPAYMAPEMAEGDGPNHSVRTDVYLLGAILHHIVTGEPPHTGDSMFEIMCSAYESAPREYEDVPDRLAEICNKAMARYPSDRYESAAEFRRALVDFKKHRRSLELSQHAEQRLEEFRRLAKQDDDGEANLYEMFGECRFGFERALEIDEHNDRARDGLQEVMVTMIEREIDQGGYKAASLLLADLPEPRPDLEDRLEELREAQENREEQFEKLKERERDRDVERGRKTRSLFVFVMGLIWGGLSYAPEPLQAMGLELGYGDLFFQSAVVAMLIALGLYVGRHDFFQNTANRQLVFSLLAIVGGILLVRKTSLALGAPLVQSMVNEMLIAAVAGAVIGICIDRRVLWTAVPYVTGGLLGATYPEYIHIIGGVCDVLAMSLLAVVWWPGNLESLAGPITAAGDDRPAADSQ